MNTRLLCGLAAVAAAFALPAQARFMHWHDGAYGHGAAADSAIHTAALNPDDQALADRVADALRDDPTLNDTTVTVAANSGRISLSGSAPDTAKASRVEQIAANVAGRRYVSGKIDAQGA